MYSEISFSFNVPIRAFEVQKLVTVTKIVCVTSYIAKLMSRWFSGQQFVFLGEILDRILQGVSMVCYGICVGRASYSS